MATSSQERQPQTVDLHIRIAKFVALSAWDILAPGIVSHPISIVRNFYDCFLVTDPISKLRLLGEASRLSPKDIEEVVDAIEIDWQPHLPHGGLNEEQRKLLRRLVCCLKEASEPDASLNPSEALRKSLNESVLSGRQFIPTELKPEQIAIGRSLIQTGLLDPPKGRGPSSLPEDAPLIPGYELQSVLGKGGFSTVYLALTSESQELRAIKVGPLNDKDRFEREVRLLTGLKGSYAVKYYDHGYLPSQFWIALEYLGDHTLADLIGPSLSPDVALLAAEQILTGLAHLHDAGVIHRDLKPYNVMVDSQFRLKLIDFGLAKPLPTPLIPNSLSMTATYVGTPAYMSPEQFALREYPTSSVDMWSFGVILFELLTGKLPFVATNPMALGHEIMSKAINIDNSRIPNEMRAFLERCLKRRAAERWSDARNALDEFVLAARAARRRILYERHRDNWVTVLEKRLLQRYASEHRGILPVDGSNLFVAFAQNEGVNDLDQERLGEILSDVFSHQSQVEEATNALLNSKKDLACRVVALTAEQLTLEASRIRRLEAAIVERQRQIDDRIRSLLAQEARTWEAKRQATQKDEQRQTAELERIAAAKAEAERAHAERMDLFYITFEFTVSTLIGICVLLLIVKVWFNL